MISVSKMVHYWLLNKKNFRNSTWKLARLIPFLQFGKELALGLTVAIGQYLYKAYQQIGVSIASLAYDYSPVIIMKLSPFLFREKLTKTKIMGFISDLPD
jgi:drug/metabolite transporter (DMT)-like permease